MLFNFRKSDKKYSSNKSPTNYLKHLYHQQSFSEIADDHVNRDPYMFETSDEIIDEDAIQAKSKNETNRKTND